jgi:hypothetical protein
MGFYEVSFLGVVEKNTDLQYTLVNLPEEFENLIFELFIAFVLVLF